MKQMTCADAEYAGKRKQTRKELFLIEMDQVVPWQGLIALIEPLQAMLRVHLMQNWFGYSDVGSAVRNHHSALVRRTEPRAHPR
jgi:IS5 family transposase